MPSIKPSSDLRNNYNEISEFYHKYDESVYLIKNGNKNLAVLSIEAYEKLIGKFELYKLLNEGLEDIKNNDVIPEDEAFKNIENTINH